MAIPHAIASRSHVVEPTQRACAADRQHGASARRRQLETSRDLYQNPYRSAREVQSKHDLTPRAQRSESTHGSDKGILRPIPEYMKVYAQVDVGEARKALAANTAQRAYPVAGYTPCDILADY